MSFYYNPSHVILKLYLPLSLIKASEQSLPAARSPLTVSSSHTEPQLVQLQGASFPHGPQGCATRWPRAQNVLGPRKWCKCAILYSFAQATPQPALQVHGELILLFPFSLPFCHSHCTQTNPTSSLSRTAFMPCTQAEQTQCVESQSTEGTTNFKPAHVDTSPSPAWEILTLRHLPHGEEDRHEGGDRAARWGARKSEGSWKPHPVLISLCVVSYLLYIY